MFKPTRKKPQHLQRRGTTAVMVLLLLVPLLAFTAFCIDVGWISLTKSELQNAADSSAKAGARQLLDHYADYKAPVNADQNGAISNAQSAARAYSALYAGYNSAGDAGSIYLRSNDIQIGFTDASGAFSADSAAYPNTVQLIARRDQLANNPLKLFFARVFGRSDSELAVTASSTVYTGRISSFKSTNGYGGGSGGGGSASGGSSSGSGFQCTLLPVAFDVNSWNAFSATGHSPDGVIHQSSNGAPQIQIYPTPHTCPGNFGMLCIGPWTNSDNQYSDWVLDGPTSSDIQCLIDNGFFPVSEETPKKWKGSPGLRSALSSDFEEIIGQPRLLPLFKPRNQSPYQAAYGVGANAGYDIVGFVGVTVSQVTGQGGNLSISVTPCNVIDASAVFDSSTITPLGCEPTGKFLTFTTLSAKLTK
jgi:Flp pilus assembly protein TadG